ncbi:Uncharacterized protein SCF082_LOCUS47035 [Durusdinium trenchii]|uniref:Uncharacterized protein n=1 Tax=Durusdinium trenchii TaxID=1381693 RepID=A0ABP0RK63_9DINO
MMQKRLNDIRMKHVVEEEKKIVFGGKVSTWHDVEGDEATFDKRDVSTEEGWQEQVQDKKCILWGQWSGLVQSGKPRDPTSAQKTLEVERNLWNARDEQKSVAERRKRLKEAQLTLHPDKGGTDAAMIWFKDWLKEHIEWYFEPDTVPENLKKQYQEDEVPACPKVV